MEYVREVPPMQIEQLLLTIPESAKPLRVSRSTIYRPITSGDIGTVVIRGLHRIRPSALRRFAETQGTP